MAATKPGYGMIKDGTDGELITWDASGNSAAVAVGTVNHVLTSSGAGAAPTFKDPGVSILNVTKGGDIASASPLVIDTDGNYFDVTGTTGYAAMTVTAGRRFTLQFDGVLTMTHHATNLDLPGEANITTAAGDVAEFFSTGSDTVQCINYTKADGGSPVAAGADYLLYQNTFASGGPASPTTYASGAWRTMEINTEVTDAGGHGSLSTNVITLAAGTYELFATGGLSTNGGEDGFQYRFYNTSDSSIVAAMNSYVGLINHDGTFTLFAEFTIAGSKNFELQARSSGVTMYANYYASTGDPEVRWTVGLRKTA